MLTDPASFRDPAGTVVHDDGHVYRVVHPPGVPQFERARDSGLLAELVDDGFLVPFTEIDPARISGRFEGAISRLLEHPRLDFISYPWEWPFAGLRAAALLQLDVHLKALARGMTLSDASAFNIQFRGTQPVFIDHLSFRPYADGEYWDGHRQFCEQFLNPLLLTAMRGIPHHAWYRATMSGIDGPQLLKILPWYRCLAPLVLLHVGLPAWLQRSRGATATAAVKRRPLPLRNFRAMLSGLRRAIDRLEAPADRGSAWADYAVNTSYRPAEATAKRRFVMEYVERERPGVVWDLGCNTGDYALACLDSGTRLVIGFDSDPAALDSAWSRARDGHRAFLPLFMDAVNPSPSQGWRESERRGLSGRSRPDGLVALALLHHLVIRHNIPMPGAIEWLLAFAPGGIIEFVPREDPMVQRLLEFREDIFPGYTREAFMNLVNRNAKVVREMELAPGGRVLVQYRRHDG